MQKNPNLVVLEYRTGICDAHSIDDIIDGPDQFWEKPECNSARIYNKRALNTCENRQIALDKTRTYLLYSQERELQTQFLNLSAKQHPDTNVRVNYFAHLMKGEGKHGDSTTAA